MDPFVVLRVGETKRRTKTAKSGGRNPNFNEKLEFSIIDGQNQLYLELFDEETVSNDQIGHAILDLNGVYQKGIYDGWVKLFAQESGKPAGELRVVIYFRPIQGVGLQNQQSQSQAQTNTAQQRPSQPTPVAIAPVAVAQVQPQVVAVQPQYIAAAPVAQMAQPIAYGSPQVQYVPQMVPMQVGYPPQPQPQMYAAPPPGYPGQPGVVYQGQPMMQPGYAPQGYAPQGYAPQGYPPQGYPPQQQQQYGAQPGYPGYR